ncbi:MAG: transketolase [Nitrospirae bacterium]|nr:transketolase [Nitrospirota bacterium]
MLLKLSEKALWVRKATLNIHRIAKETRIASSLSVVEILVVLYYGKLLSFDPKDTKWEKRDRFIISKGHGSISLYPILSDLGFFGSEQLDRVCMKGALLGGIPDPLIPGYETINGSLGHGLGVGCGVSLGLKLKSSREFVFVLLGDGELFEGAVWEAVMFAGQHKLSNLILILDNNKVCMLDYCKNIIDLESIAEKFRVFKWQVIEVDGHDIGQVSEGIKSLRESKIDKPKLLLANTIKGKGVPSLETDPLSHIRILSSDEVDTAIAGLS